MAIPLARFRARCFLNITNFMYKTSIHFVNPAMSNPNGLLSQKLCHYLDQGRTLNDILLRAARTLNDLV